MSTKTPDTNYAGHEELYLRRRREAANGWDSDEVTRENIQAIEHLLSKCDPRPSGAMLELGCGAGNLTTHFAQSGWEAHGIDISPTAVAWALERSNALGLTLDVRTGSVLELEPYATSRFDLVLDGHCLHCIIGVDRSRFFQEAMRVLKPGGKLLVLTMAGDASAVPMRGQYDPVSRCQVIDGTMTRYFGDPLSIVDEIVQAGFRVDYEELQVRSNASETDHLLVVAGSPA